MSDPDDPSAPPRPGGKAQLPPVPYDPIFENRDTAQPAPVRR